LIRRSALRGFLLAALCGLPAWGAGIGPDAFGYRASNDVAFSFLNIATSGTRILAGSDDDTATLNIGFPFRFYGVTYTSLCVSPNGLISFGGCNADFGNSDLTSTRTSGNRPTMAVFWDDLTFDTRGADGVYYQTLGTSGNRQFVLQWNNLFGINMANGMTFQVVLAENGHAILFQYLDVEAGAPALSRGASATVGIRDADGNTSRRVLQWSFNSPVLRNNMAIRFTPYIQVTIDIKPGGVPNPINLGSKGNVPVAIFSTPTFDARTVNPATVTLASAGVRMRGRGRSQASFEDVNGDGRLDLVVHIDTEALQLSATDTEAVLEGRTFDGAYIRGTDTIRIVH